MKVKQAFKKFFSSLYLGEERAKLVGRGAMVVLLICSVATVVAAVLHFVRQIFMPLQ